MVGCKDVKKTGICGNIFPIFAGIALGAMESRKEDASNKLVI